MGNVIAMEKAIRLEAVRLYLSGRRLEAADVMFSGGYGRRKSMEWLRLHAHKYKKQATSCREVPNPYMKATCQERNG